MMKKMMMILEIIKIIKRQQLTKIKIIINLHIYKVIITKP